MTGFRQLTDLQLAVAGDATSEITLFGLAGADRTDSLVAALSQADRPVLADFLQPGDVVVDLAVARDLGAGVRRAGGRRRPEPHARGSASSPPHSITQVPKMGAEKVLRGGV